MAEACFRGHKKAFAVLLLSFLWAIVLHSVFVADIGKDFKLANFTETFSPTGAEVECTVELEPGHYLLKVNHEYLPGKSVDVVFNGSAISPFKGRMRRSNTEQNDYYRLPPNLVQRNSTLKLHIDPGFSQELRIVLRNYRHSLAHDKIVILHRPYSDPSYHFAPFRSVLPFASAYLFVCIVIFFLNSQYRHLFQDIALIFNAVLTAIAVANYLSVFPYIPVIDSSYAIFWLVLAGLVIGAVRLTPFLIRSEILHRALLTRTDEYAQHLLSMRVNKVMVFAFVALVTPLLMLHGMWEHPGLYPVEIFDESTHAYTEVPIVQKALLEGHIQKMNFFNNFGTPFLGDPIANPYALHALAYFFFKPYIAIIINKMLFWMLTYVVLFAFYRRRGLSFYSSILTAVLTASAPTFYWFLQHHPHQGVLFYFSCVLLATDLAYSRPKTINYLLLHLSFVAYFLSSGIIGIFLGLPYVLVFTLIFVKFNVKAFAKLFLLPLASALILTHPHFLYFLKISGLTWREGFTWEDVNPYSFTDLLRGCTFLTITCDYHTDFSINYSLTVLVFALLGLFAFRRDRDDLNRRLALVLGLAPLLMVTIMLRYRSLQSVLPVVSTIDSTRALWFATVFLMIPLGVFLDRLSRTTLSLVLVRRLLYVLAPLLLGASCVLWTTFSIAELCLYVLSPIFILIAYCLLLKYRPNDRGVFRALSILFVLSLLFPRHYVYDKITNGLYVSEEMTSYSPVEFARRMHPYYRLATRRLPLDLDPSSSSDQKIAKYNIFGSGGRSIIAHGSFRALLEENHKIAYGEKWRSLLYYFEPDLPEKLAPLGIRYFVAEIKDSAAIEKLGWRRIMTVERAKPRAIGLPAKTTPDQPGQPNGLALFENPLEPSPIYYIHEGDIHFIHSYAFRHDTIEIDLPPPAGDDVEIVAAFIAWPGWKAWVNGKDADIFTRKDQFLRVKCRGGRKLILEFEPYSDSYICAAGLISLVFMLGCCLLLPKSSGQASIGLYDRKSHKTPIPA